MERLTEKFVCNLPDEVLEKLGIADVPKEDYEIKETHGATCKETCEEHECSDCPISKAINKLAAYEDAEEQGLLLRLPVAIGDKVYEIIEETVPGHHFYISEYEIQDVSAKAVKYADDWCEYGYPNLYLTREEAKQALKQIGE